jgi:hypothetical protein
MMGDVANNLISRHHCLQHAADRDCYQLPPCNLRIISVHYINMEGDDGFILDNSIHKGECGYKKVSLRQWICDRGSSIVIE